MPVMVRAIIALGAATALCLLLTGGGFAVAEELPRPKQKASVTASKQRPYDMRALKAVHVSPPFGAKRPARHLKSRMTR